METYRAEYRWTKEELVRAQKHHYQTSLRPSIVMLMNIWIFLLALMSLFLFFKGGGRIASLIFLGFAGYWFLLRQKVTVWWLTRDFGKRPDANAQVQFEISQEIMKSHIEGLASSEVRWNLFIKIIETSEGFLLYHQKNFFYWLPFSAFKDAEIINKFREFARESGIEYKVSAR